MSLTRWREPWPTWGCRCRPSPMCGLAASWHAAAAGMLPVRSAKNTRSNSTRGHLFSSRISHSPFETYFLYCNPTIPRPSAALCTAPQRRSQHICGHERPYYLERDSRDHCARVPPHCPTPPSGRHGASNQSAVRLAGLRTRPRSGGGGVMDQTHRQLPTLPAPAIAWHGPATSLTRCYDSE